MSCDTPARLTHYSGRCHLNHIKVKSSQVKSTTYLVRESQLAVAVHVFALQPPGSGVRGIPVPMSSDNLYFSACKQNKVYMYELKMCEIPQAHRLIVAASCPQYAAFAANSPNVKLSVSSHSSKTLQLTLTRGARPHRDLMPVVEQRQGSPSGRAFRIFRATLFFRRALFWPLA